MNCDVLVVGGGLMGCATAHELAKRGHSVIVSERNAAPGLETTARSGAIIRAHYGVPELVAMALEANRRFENFGALFGGDAGFVRSGYAVLVDEHDVGTLCANTAMHRDLGVRVDIMDAAAFQSLAPGVQTADVALVAYESHGGYASPALTVKSLSAGAMSRGAVFLYEAPVTRARRQDAGWEIVLADGTLILCGQVVICTGNWSVPVGEIFDLALPVTPMRAQIVVLDRPAPFQGPMPVVSDLINLAYFRADGPKGMWVGSSDSADLQDFHAPPLGNEAIPHKSGADDDAIRAAKAKAALRFRGLESAAASTVQRAFCGLYETTPDWQPIIDSFDDLHLAVGFSGHGFKLATVMGEEMACRVEGNRSPYPTAIFDLARFDAGRTIAAQHKYERAKFLR